MLSRGGSGPGGEDGDDDDDDRRYDGQKRDGFISKWLLPTTSERRALSSDSELSQGDDIVSVATNATSAGTNDFDSVTEVRNRSALLVFDLDQTLVSSGRHGVVVAEQCMRREGPQCYRNHSSFHRSMSARRLTGGNTYHGNSNSIGINNANLISRSLYRTSSMPFSSVPQPLDPNVYVNQQTGEREVLLYRGEDSAWDLVYVKLRPGVRKLLSESREIADLAIFSAASSTDYVHFIARHLDPSGCLFDGRIYSSQELGIGTDKSTEVLPAGYEKVVIVDDSGSSIWHDVDTDICCFPIVPPYTFMRDHIADILNGTYVRDEDHFLIDDLLPQLTTIVSNMNSAS